MVSNIETKIVLPVIVLHSILLCYNNLWIEPVCWLNNRSVACTNTQFLDILACLSNVFFILLKALWEAKRWVRVYNVAPLEWELYREHKMRRTTETNCMKFLLCTRSWVWITSMYSACWIRRLWLCMCSVDVALKVGKLLSLPATLLRIKLIRYCVLLLLNP